MHFNKQLWFWTKYICLTYIMSWFVKMSLYLYFNYLKTDLTRKLKTNKQITESNYTSNLVQHSADNITKLKSVISAKKLCMNFQNLSIFYICFVCWSVWSNSHYFTKGYKKLQGSSNLSLKPIYKNPNIFPIAPKLVRKLSPSLTYFLLKTQLGEKDLNIY